MNTTFFLSAPGWTDVAAHLPLAYQFWWTSAAIAPASISTENAAALSGITGSAEVRCQLPAGAGSNWSLSLLVAVQDSLGARFPPFHYLVPTLVLTPLAQKRQ